MENIEKLNEIHNLLYGTDFPKEVNEKKCGKCKNVFPLTQYGKNIKTKDKLQCYCKGCKKIDNNKMYRTKTCIKNKDKIKKNKETKADLHVRNYAKQFNLGMTCGEVNCSPDCKCLNAFLTKCQGKKN